VSPIPRWTSTRTGSQVFEADCRAVAATLPDGCASLAILDGPYGMGKAAWDRVSRGGSLLDLYRDHLADVGRVCAPSASLYLWNTAEGWGELHPAIVAAGWTFRSLIVWDKDNMTAIRSTLDGDKIRCWPNLTEVCGFYQREAWAARGGAGQEIGYAAGRDDRNWVRPWLAAEWAAAGLRMKDADRALGTNGMAGHYFQASQWSLPTWDAFKRLAEHAAEHGPPRAVPYLTLERFAGADGLAATYDHLRAEYDHLRAEYDHLRAEYEASRPPFAWPEGIGNVWRAFAGPERLRAPDGSTLHPCQKPLAFAARMIRASSRPGDTVWAPFGGTLRELVAAERIAAADPADGRRVITCELNADGADYIGPALGQVNGAPMSAHPRQGALFGGGR